MRWPEGVKCPRCGSEQVNKRGMDDTQAYRQRYICQGCGRQVDDLTGSIFAARRQPLRVGIRALANFWGSGK
ncbi:transposase [Synechococcus sp. PCC 7336]|uniref:IS1/IS1595 family N-terminal zinc-binding domain-containing protein n=1 Tax=Synechococcus sp. PCC 7336 TaxID=195250 RepID=UPI0008FBFE90